MRAGGKRDSEKEELVPAQALSRLGPAGADRECGYDL